MKMSSDGRLNDREAQRDGKETPYCRIFIGITGGQDRENGSHENMEQDKTPGSINNRKDKSNEDVGQPMQPQEVIRYQIRKVKLDAVQGQLPGNVPITRYRAGF